MQISHVPEDDETFFYPLGLRGLVTKGLTLGKKPAMFRYVFITPLKEAQALSTVWCHV